MTTTIAIVNKKGGSGKTTTAISLGGAYARAGMRCLLIDMDPQADLTSALSPADPDDLPLETTSAALFDDDLFVSAARLVVPTAFPNLSLLRTSELLRPASRLAPAHYVGWQFALRSFVKDIAPEFDRVLIDNSPDLGFCAWAALTAADFALTPVQADAKGFKGLGPINRFIGQVREATNPELAQLGYVRTVYEARKAVHAGYSAKIERDYPGLLLQESFPKAAHFQEADIARQPVGFYKPRSAAAKACERIIAEIEERIKRLRQVAAAEPRTEAA